MKVYSRLHVKVDLVPFKVGLGHYEGDVKKSLLKEYPNAKKIKVTAVKKKADESCNTVYWQLTAEGEV